MKYCDGGSLAGDSKVTYMNRTLYFHGKRNRDSLIRTLLTKYGMSSATDVLISGCSAGALGVFLGIDQIADIIRAANPRIRVRGLADSGFFMEFARPNITYYVDGYNSPVVDGQLNFVKAMSHMYNFMNISSGTHPDCVRAFSNGSQCMFAAHVLPFVRTPIFIFQSKFDSWQGIRVLGDLTNDYALINMFGSLIRQTLLNALQASLNTSHAVFLDACSHHCSSCSEVGNHNIWNSNMITAIGSAYNAGQTFASWFDRTNASLAPATKHEVYEQNGTYPCHSCCNCYLHPILPTPTPTGTPTYSPTTAVSAKQDSLMCSLIVSLGAAFVFPAKCNHSRPLGPVCSGSSSNWGSYVTCGSSGFVTAIYLFGWSLSGSLPSALGQLSLLTSLSLELDGLSGPLPSSLGQLTNLVNLRLISNRLSGPLPSVLGALTRLRYLMLDDNVFSGAIPTSLGYLRHLLSLRLFNNRLTGSVPSSLCGLPGLSVLRTYGDSQRLTCYDSCLSTVAAYNFGNIPVCDSSPPSSRPSSAPSSSPAPVDITASVPSAEPSHVPIQRQPFHASLSPFPPPPFSQQKENSTSPSLFKSICRGVFWLHKYCK